MTDEASRGAKGLVSNLLAEEPGVKKHPRRRRRAILTGAIALLLAVLLAAAGVLTFFSQYRLEGNPGVVAAFEYALAYANHLRSIGSSVGPEVLSRLGQEAFEAKCAMIVSYNQSGVEPTPFDSIPIGLSAKYDKTDFGVKLSAMGIGVLSAYIIGDEFALKIGDAAGSEKIDLPVEADLKEPMAFTDRVAAFLPFLAEDHTDIYMGLLEIFAQSVPDKHTHAYTVYRFSPAAGRSVKTTVVETVLDTKAILDVLERFAARLRNDEALCDKIQTLLDDVTKHLDMEDADFDDVIDAIEEVDEQDIQGLELSWEVYRRQGEYRGMSYTLTLPDEMGTLTSLTEFDGNTVYSANHTESYGTVNDTESFADYDGNHMEFEAEMTETTEMSTVSMLETGSMDSARTRRDEYAFDIDMNIGLTMSYNQEYLEEMFSDFDTLYGDDSFFEDTEAGIQLTGDISVLFGDELETLREDRSWDDIYEKDWGTLEDAFEGVYSLWGMFDDLMGVA